MARKPRLVFMVCVPPPKISDAIWQWTKHQARYWPFVEDENARREARFASAVIAWKLNGERGPAPEREFEPLPPAPKAGGTVPA